MCAMTKCTSGKNKCGCGGCGCLAAPLFSPNHVLSTTIHDRIFFLFLFLSNGRRILYFRFSFSSSLLPYLSDKISIRDFGTNTQTDRHTRITDHSKSLIENQLFRLCPVCRSASRCLAVFWGNLNSLNFSRLLEREREKKNILTCHALLGHHRLSWHHLPSFLPSSIFHLMKYNSHLRLGRG